jgi:hypothetical protein
LPIAFVQLAAIRLWLRVIKNRVFLFLRFELLDERSDTRGDGGRKSVVLELEAAPQLTAKHFYPERESTCFDEHHLPSISEG